MSAVAQYLQHLAAERRLSLHTVEAYQRDLANLIRLVDDRPLAELTVTDIRGAIVRLRGKSLSAMVPQVGSPPPKPSSSFFSGFASQLTVASLTKPGLYAPASVRSDMSPTAAYSAIALAVKRCWLAYAKPRLPNHNFDGEASLNDGGQAKIAIYERVEGQKLGRFAFRVEINASGSGSTVESVNVRLSEDDSERLRADIARWADGGEGCSA